MSATELIAAAIARGEITMPAKRPLSDRRKILRARWKRNAAKRGLTANGWPVESWPGAAWWKRAVEKAKGKP